MEYPQIICYLSPFSTSWTSTPIPVDYLLCVIVIIHAARFKIVGVRVSQSVNRPFNAFNSSFHRTQIIVLPYEIKHILKFCYFSVINSSINETLWLFSAKYRHRKSVCNKNDKIRVITIIIAAGKKYVEALSLK